MDVCKTRLQVASARAVAGQPKPTLSGMVKEILAKDGFQGFYAGLSASLMRQAIYGTARLGLHREFSDQLKKSQGGGELPFWKSVLASMSSGALASLIGTPFDLAMVRLQSDSLAPPEQRRNYKHVFDALARIPKEDGGVGKLWRGVEPTMLRAIAMNVGMMAAYDQAKQVVASINGPGLGTDLTASAISGFSCVITSLPADLIKTRLQNMRPDPTTGKLPYKGLADCAVKIARTEGVLAFWTGFGAYYLRTAPHAMIILLSMEQLNKAYSKAIGS